MKIKNIFPALGIVALLIVSMASCEEDFGNLDSVVIVQDNEIPDTTMSVVTYSRKVLPVQSNNLPIYSLGVYNDPVYGKTTSNFLTQLSLETQNPSFPNDSLVVLNSDGSVNYVIDREFIFESAILRIPYFADVEEVDGENVYTLDSVYGESPINIRIRETGFFLRELDPSSGFQEIQKYYSNQGPTFESNIASAGALTDLDITIMDFVPSPEEVEIVTEVLDTTSTLTLAPGLIVEMPLDFWQKRIIDMEGEEPLANNNNFKEYMRGLQFTIEDTGGGDNMFYFGTAGASITLNYSSNRILSDTLVPDENGIPIRDSSRLTINFADVSVNTFENNLPQEVVSAISNPNINEGVETLYLKGGEGVMSVIELFKDDSNNNGIDDLEELREQELLINEANLKFYVDQDKVTGGSNEPERIKIFDITNGRILADYQFDITATEEDPNEALTIHLGRLERGTDNNGDFYKIRLTNHISNLINSDSTNVPLGLSVSQNVLVTQFQDVENIQAPGLDTYPVSSIIAREGTVLHGNLSPDEDKRVRLELYFTKPE